MVCKDFALLVDPFSTTTVSDPGELLQNSFLKLPTKGMLLCRQASASRSPLWLGSCWLSPDGLGWI
jgi:hypothetical protein